MLRCFRVVEWLHGKKIEEYSLTEELAAMHSMLQFSMENKKRRFI